MRSVRPSLPVRSQSVMAGLDPAIHVLDQGASVDDRAKPSHDDVVDCERQAARQRLSLAGGVRIAGVDLSQPLSTELRDAILGAVLAHPVVLFPYQALAPEQHF